MTDNRDFLGTEPVGRLLFKLAIPTVFAQLVNMLYNVVDRIYIGHMPGEGDLALTGIGICMPIILIVSAFASLISAGGAPRASIFMGKHEMRSAEETLGSCFAAQLAVSAALTIVLSIWNRDLLMAFGGSENTIGYATAYMSIYALGTLFVQLTLGMNAFVTAQGFTKISMTSVLIGAALNIALDPLFIFVLKMNVRGAALATVISQAASCAWALRFLFSKQAPIRIYRKNIAIRPKMILPCLALGLAPFVMQASESVISVCFNASLQKYGKDIAVGAMTILTSVMQLAMLPLQGVSQGAQPITSYNYGAGNRERVKQSFFVLLKVSALYSLVLWALVMLLPEMFAKIFTAKAELISFSAKALRVYCGAMFMFGIQIACQMTFISLGNAKSSIIVAVVRKFVLLLPLIYIVPCFMQDKTTAVYLAEPIADFTAVCFTGVLFFYQFRKTLKSMRQ